MRLFKERERGRVLQKLIFLCLFEHIWYGSPTHGGPGFFSAGFLTSAFFCTKWREKTRWNRLKIPDFIVRNFIVLWQVRENCQALYFEKMLTYKRVVLAKNLREFARKLVPNFELSWKVCENKSARKFLIFMQTKCAKICPRDFYE